jgi:iron complex transport system permease protein
MRWAVLALLLAAALVAALMGGTVWVSPADAAQALVGQGTPFAVQVVRELRLPRAVLAALVGAGLGAAGSALQGALRNPLAEPYLLGVSGGAAVGGVLAFALGLSSGALLPIAAFAGALGAVTLVTGLARVAGHRTDPRVLVMAGVVVGAGANAAVMVALSRVPPERARGALWWMMGSAGDASWSSVLWLTVWLTPALLWLWREGPTLDLLALGEEPAAALGADVERASRRVFVAASLVAAATVSAAGLVGFVGLVVPHLARSLGARGHRTQIPVAAVSGATLLVLADLLARSATAPSELPLGAVTALVGVPFFLSRLRRVAA